MITKLTRTERKVLDFFVQKPEEEIHVRGLSQENDMPYSTVRNVLSQLEEKDIVESDQKSKMKFYSTGENFHEIKKLINLEKLKDSGLSNHIEEEIQPEAVVLFGSYIEGRDTKESDIDIAVIKGRDKEPELDKFEKELNRKISLKKIEKPENESKEFKNTLANGLTLKGYLKIV